MVVFLVSVGAHLSLKSFQNHSEETSGLYLVYRINKEDGRLKLIYVGKSVDVSERVDQTHEHYNDWLDWADGQEDRLRFSCVVLQNHETEVLRCEAAMIYAFQPPINDKGKDSFSYEDTMVIFNGRQVCHRSLIIAQKTI